ncbi:nucleotidyltransferase family protein [Grimontia marina]|nr:nucleotidyltransferase family protein [Grimontia marina]
MDNLEAFIPKLDVLLLAAGMSTRMGDINKLCIPVDGEPMVRRSAKLYLSLGIKRLVVVVGFESERIADALSGLPIHFVFNADYERGQHTSIKAGLTAINPDSHSIVVALADQPFLTRNDVRQLILSHLEKCGSLEAYLVPVITVPTVFGQRGNPVLMTRNCIALAGKDDLRPACRRLIEEHPDWVNTLECHSVGFCRDIDTPNDMALLN